MVIEKQIIKELQGIITQYAKPSLANLNFQTRRQKLIANRIIKDYLLLLNENPIKKQRFREIILDRSFINRIVDSIRESINTI